MTGVQSALPISSLWNQLICLWRMSCTSLLQEMPITPSLMRLEWQYPLYCLWYACVCTCSAQPKLRFIVKLVYLNKKKEENVTCMGWIIMHRASWYIRHLLGCWKDVVCSEKKNYPCNPLREPSKWFGLKIHEPSYERQIIELKSLLLARWNIVAFKHSPVDVMVNFVLSTHDDNSPCNFFIL